MPIEAPDTAAKTYLQAIGAAAIYVATDNGIPVSVGVARDLNVALRNMHKIMSPAIRLGWVAWASNYNGLVAISRMPDLLYGERDGIKVALPLDHVVRRIEISAREDGITLTPHYKAIERASAYAERLDEAFAAMQDAGLFKTFNRAYRTYRLRQGRQGKSARPFFMVTAELRAIIVRLLVANQFSTDAALEEIRKRFPWFTRYRKDGRKRYDLTNWQKRNSRA